MADQPKRFIELSVLVGTLEDPVMQQVRTGFLVNTVLPSKIVAEKIKQLVIAELKRSKFIGVNESFATQAACQMVDLNGISTFLEKTFGTEWTKRG